MVTKDQFNVKNLLMLIKALTNVLLDNFCPCFTINFGRPNFSMIFALSLLLKKDIKILYKL